MSYFDWNATAPALPQAQAAWMEAAAEHWANPSTPYRSGQRARLELESARDRVAVCLGVEPVRVVFTSGATEANNGVIREFAARAGPDQRVWISAVEHPSVRESAWAYWGRQRTVQIPVSAAGVTDLDWIVDNLAGERPSLVSVMALNNETGVIQPWREVLAACRQRGVPFHCDAVQWAGKLALKGEDLAGMAGLTLSGHKFGAPKGTGLFIRGGDWSSVRLQAGGVQEGGARAGTENLPGALALAVALEHRCGGLPYAAANLARDQFEAALAALWPGEIEIHGQGAPRVWNTCSVSLPVHRAERWIARLDRHGFQVSSGSACSTGREGPSAILQAMGVAAESARRTVRISSGWETTAADWEGLLAALKQVRAELDASGPAAGPARVIEV